MAAWTVATEPEVRATRQAQRCHARPVDPCNDWYGFDSLRNELRTKPITELFLRLSLSTRSIQPDWTIDSVVIDS